MKKAKVTMPEHYNSFTPNCIKKTPLLLRLGNTIHNTMGMAMEHQLHVLFLWVTLVVISVSGARGIQYISAVGDPGMRRDELRVALEAWNFCNEVGEEAPGMGSPRAADCFDLSGKQCLRGKLKIKVGCFFFFFFISMCIAFNS
jgi:hypothetical protein